VGHAEIKIGDSIIMLADEHPAMDAPVIAHVVRLGHEARPDDAGVYLEAHVQAARVFVAADEASAVVR